MHIHIINARVTNYDCIGLSKHHLNNLSVYFQFCEFNGIVTHTQAIVLKHVCTCAYIDYVNKSIEELLELSIP